MNERDLEAIKRARKAPGVKGDIYQRRVSSAR